MPSPAYLHFRATLVGPDKCVLQPAEWPDSPDLLKNALTFGLNGATFCPLVKVIVLGSSMNTIKQSGLFKAHSNSWGHFILNLPKHANDLGIAHLLAQWKNLNYMKVYRAMEAQKVYRQIHCSGPAERLPKHLVQLLALGRYPADRQADIWWHAAGDPSLISPDDIHLAAANLNISQVCKKARKSKMAPVSAATSSAALATGTTISCTDLVHALECIASGNATDVAVGVAYVQSETGRLEVAKLRTAHHHIKWSPMVDSFGEPTITTTDSLVQVPKPPPQSSHTQTIASPDAATQPAFNVLHRVENADLTDLASDPGKSQSGLVSAAPISPPVALTAAANPASRGPLMGPSASDVQTDNPPTAPAADQSTMIAGVRLARYGRIISVQNTEPRSSTSLLFLSSSHYVAIRKNGMPFTWQREFPSLAEAAADYRRIVEDLQVQGPKQRPRLSIIDRVVRAVSD